MKNPMKLMRLKKLKAAYGLPRIGNRDRLSKQLRKSDVFPARALVAKD